MMSYTEVLIFFQMRAYLHKNKSRLRVDTLIMYCYQLSTALSYLESKHFVHRSVFINALSLQNFSIKLLLGIYCWW